MKGDTKYLNRFFEEKQLENVNYSIMDSNGATHIFDNETLIDRIKSTSPKEQNLIATILKRIDFKNGSVQHFLNYLAEAMVNQWTR